MNGVVIIDCDGHVAEPWDVYQDYVDPEFRHRVPRRVDVDGQRFVIVDDKVYPGFVRSGPRPLGGVDRGNNLPRPVQRPELEVGGVDPHRRLKDMEVEGIDIAVLFPSGAASMSAVPDPQLEAALYRAYHRWLAEYCAADPNRLRGVALAVMRDAELGAAEIRRIADEPWVAGILISPHFGERNLDDPSLDPIWSVAQELDLPVCIHAACGRPPYALGTEESSDNLFLMHAMAHPFEQMRALAATIGGGVFDRFPGIRVAFLEAGLGWVPWWLDRLHEHAEGLREHVPLMNRDPLDYVREGQVWFSCEPEEPLLEAALDHVGDGAVMFASDYPHWDCGFPETVNRLKSRPQLRESSKVRLLGENARRFYTRLVAD
jgi:predicted TIM-barrel fold metal-dependent hydrolase